MSEARAPIQHQNELAPLQQLIQYIGGERTKGTTTTTSTADVDPLRQIFAQQSDPNALMALVQSLFQQGAMQVPGLTSQFANATGTRTTGNSMLGQSLALLNQNIAQAISQSVVQQQANASATAGRIGESTRGETKSTNVTRAASPRGTGLSLLVPALGVLANQMGKKPAAARLPAPAEDAEAGYGLGGPDSNTPTAPIEAPTLGAVDVSEQVLEPVNFMESPTVDFAPGAMTLSGDYFGADTFDLGDGGGYETGAGEAAADVGLEVGGDTVFEEAVDWFGGADFGFGFAEGGQVPAAGSRRNVAQFGARPVIPTTAAISYNNQLIQNRAANPPPSRRRTEVGTSEEMVEDGLSRTSTGGGTIGSGNEAAAAGAAAGGIGGSGISPSAALGAMMGLALGGFPGMISGFIQGQARGLPAMLAMGTPAQGLTEQEMAALAEMEAMGFGLGGPDPGAPGISGQPGTSVDLGGPDPGEAGPGTDPGTSTDIGGPDPGAAGPSAGDPGTGTDVGGADADAGAGADGDAGGDDSGGDFYSGGMVHGKKKKKGYAEGGRVGDERAERYIAGANKKSNSMGSPSVVDDLMDVIFKSPIDRRGPKFGVPPGSKDSVSINVSPGEYVLPVDVVELVGADNLDELVSLAHTPTGGKKRG